MQSSGGATAGTGGSAPATGGKPGTGGQPVGTGGATSAGGAGGATSDAAVRDSASDPSGSTGDTSQGHDTTITPGSDAKVDPSTLPAVTLWLAGDSTVSPYGAASAQQGWGEQLAEFFNSKVTVQNKAVGGRTVTSFDWSPIETGVKAGDYVMIEFGINDSSTAGGRYVSPADFQTKLSTEVDTLLAKKAIPIMVTPSALQGWQSDGTNSNTREQPYCDAMKAVATAKGILVDDLNARSLENLNKIGQAAAAAIYINGDKAHFTLKGATLMAQYVTQELVRIGSPLGAYVN
jgi:lysophospholipase L1-like esterase